MTEDGGQLLAVLPTDASITNGATKVPLKAIADPQGAADATPASA